MPVPRPVETGVLAATGAVTVTAFDAVITLPWTVLVASSGAVTVAALQPEVEVTERVLVGSTGAVAVLGKNPAVTTGAETLISCGKGAVAVAGKQPEAYAPTGVHPNKGAVAVAGYRPALPFNISTHDIGKTTPPEASVAGRNTLLNEETAALASKGSLVVVGHGTTVWYATKVSAARGAVSVAGKTADVSIIQPGIPATLGAVTVAAVSPAFALPHWKRTRVLAQSKPVTILGKAASIIAPIIATTLGTVAVASHAAAIHEAHIQVDCKAGYLYVAGYETIIGTKVNVATKGAVTVTGRHTAASISANAYPETGAITIHSHGTIVNALPVWATRGDVAVLGRDPFVVAPFTAGESVSQSLSSQNYITDYQDWAHAFPAPIARRWQQFLMDTFFIATPAAIAGGTGNRIELTTDVEITKHTIGQAWRFIATPPTRAAPSST